MRRSATEPIALYVRIASILKGRILRGDWPAGTQVPGVDQLSASYKVARATARQALQLLVAEHLISSQRGRGSHVIYERPPLQDIDAGLFRVFTAPSAGHRITVLSRAHRVALPADLLGHGVAFDAYTLVRKVHAQDGLPYGYFEVYIPREIFARFPKGADARHKVVTLLKDAGVQLSKGRETLTLHSADWDEARHLECQMAMPVARMVRTITDRSRRVVYAARNIYRGDRFRQERDVAGYFHSQKAQKTGEAQAHVHPA